MIKKNIKSMMIAFGLFASGLLNAEVETFKFKNSTSQPLTVYMDYNNSSPQILNIGANATYTYSAPQGTCLQSVRVGNSILLSGKPNTCLSGAYVVIGEGQNPGEYINVPASGVQSQGRR